MSTEIFRELLVALIGLMGLPLGMLCSDLTRPKFVGVIAIVLLIISLSALMGSL